MLLYWILALLWFGCPPHYAWRDLYKHLRILMTVIRDKKLWFVCLFNHLCGSANTNSSTTKLRDCCQATFSYQRPVIDLFCKQAWDFVYTSLRGTHFALSTFIWELIIMMQPVKQESVDREQNCSWSTTADCFFCEWAKVFLLDRLNLTIFKRATKS